MLKFYYHPLSPIARRVWIVLLEKQIPHQPIVVDLAAREHLKPEFLAINPFHHVPAIVDGDLRVIESIAIMDYLELRYPSPALIPNHPAASAKMRMVQMITTNELMPNFIPIINAAHQPIPNAVQKRLTTAWQFLEDELQDQKYFGGGGVISPSENCLNLGDIVAGATVPLFHRLGLSLADYPRLDAWRQRIEERPAWQQTRPDEESFQRWQRWIQLQIERKTKSLVRG
jgi:glutathione S-transferase